MALTNLTDRELKAVIFAVERDLETVLETKRKGDDSFGDDYIYLESSLWKLRLVLIIQVSNRLIAQ